MYADDHALVFVTLVHNQRQPFSRDPEDKKQLLRIMREIKVRFHLSVAGYVILDDHTHWLFNSERALPAAVVTDLKAQYTRAYRLRHPDIQSAPLWNGGYKFLDVETTEEIHGLLDFIHYDPVRHGVVERPMDYEWSSLPARVLQGHYPEDWCSQAPPARLASLPLLRGLQGTPAQPPISHPGKSRY